MENVDRFLRLTPRWIRIEEPHKQLSLDFGILGSGALYNEKT